MTAMATAQLALVNLTGVEDSEWISKLKGTSDAWAANTISRLADVEAALEEDECRHAVIIYNDPVWDIAHHLHHGDAPTEALAKWQKLAERLVKLHRAFWDRIVVLAIPLTGHEQVENLSNYLNKNSAVPFGSISTVGLPMVQDELDKHDARSVSMQLVALQLLNIRNSKEIYEELEAISFSGDSSKRYVLELISVFLDVQSDVNGQLTDKKEITLENKAQKSELESVKRENVTLLHQLHSTQEELEQLVLKNRDINNKIRGMRRGRDYRKAKIAELQQELLGREKKIEGLRRGREYRRAKIAELQEEARQHEKEMAHLKSEFQQLDEKTGWLRSVRDRHRQVARELRIERRQQEERIDDLENRLSDLDAKLKRLKGSRAWKYTRILRKFNGTEV